MTPTETARPRPGQRGGPHLLRRLLLAFVSPNSYGMVLGLIVATYVVAVSASARWAPVVMLIQVVTVWFALRTSRTARVIRIVVDALLVVAVLFAFLDVFTGLPDEPESRVFAISAVLYLIAPISMIRHVATRPRVDLETLLGAIGAYLMIGMCFAFAYRFIALESAIPFFGLAGEGTLDQVLFFSFTTLTTTGFGNYVPVANPGQALSVAEMLFGQLFLIIAVGKVISAWQPARRQAVLEQENDETDGSAPEAGRG
jgi:hypothetical protein